MNKADNNVGTIIEELCDKYNFETRLVGFNDNAFIEVYAKNTDNKDVLWFDIQISNHDSAYGKPFEPVITLHGNTDQNNIWLRDTRKDLSLKDIIDFCKTITELCNCKLTTTPHTKYNEIYIHRLVDIEDLQETKGYKSLDDVKRYIDFEDKNEKEHSNDMEIEYE